MRRSQQAFSAPSKQTQSSNAKDELSSTASINASSTTLIPSSKLLASKPRDCTLKREQNSCYEHDNGLKIDEGESLMALYELRTYTLYVGKMAEATKLYQELGFPALKKGGHDKKLVGYFQADTGTINQLVHLWKFDDDADRRKHWAGVFRNPA